MIAQFKNFLYISLRSLSNRPHQKNKTDMSLVLEGKEPVVEDGSWAFKKPRSVIVLNRYWLPCYLTICFKEINCIIFLCKIYTDQEFGTWMECQRSGNKRNLVSNLDLKPFQFFTTEKFGIRWILNWEEFNFACCKFIRYLFWEKCLQPSWLRPSNVLFECHLFFYFLCQRRFVQMVGFISMIPVINFQRQTPWVGMQQNSPVRPWVLTFW